MRRTLLCTVVLLLGCTAATAQFPDMIYYKFDEGVGTMTVNLANPGVGSPLGTIVGGHTLNVAGGQFNGGLTLSGAGGADHVDTGYVTALGGSDWTISMWLDLSTVAAVNPFGYFFGDSTAGSFRAFSNGAAGLGNVILRGPITDVIITGGANQAGPQVVTWVHDSAAGVIKGYLNGVLVNTVPQAAPNINGTANLKVAGYATSTGMPAGTGLDEFRMYSYALTDLEVMNTATVELFDQNILTISQSGPGVGDLIIDLTAVSPTAYEGFTLYSTNTSLPEGAGPMLGIVPVAETWSIFSFPYSPGAVFHFNAQDPAPLFPNGTFTFPPGTLTPATGITIDVVCLFFGQLGGYDSKSNVVRYTIQ